MATYKSAGGVEDLTFGMDREQQERRGKAVFIQQINGSYIPYSLTQTVTAKLDELDATTLALRIDVDNIREDCCDGGGTIPPPGGGETDPYTNTEPMPEALGGYPVGTTFDEVEYKEMWDGLLYPYQVPSFSSFYLDGVPTTKEVGSSINREVTFKWATVVPQNIISDSVQIDNTTDNITLIEDTGNDGTEDISLIDDIVYTAPASHIFSIEASTSNNNIIARSATYRWYWKMYYGNDAKPALDGTQVKGLSESLLASSYARTYQIVGADYKYICYPTAFGTATSFVDADTGFSIPFILGDVVSVMNQYGVATDFNVHRSMNKLGSPGQAINIVVSATLSTNDAGTDSILGGVPVGGFIAPYAEANTYAVIDPTYGIDGHRSVVTLGERDNISTERRREGMTVYVSSEEQTYQLRGGTSNTFWKMGTSALYYVSTTDPSDGTEYPDNTGQDPGAFWIITGFTGAYTFIGGDLTGLTADSGDYMIWGAVGWELIAGQLDPDVFYMLDGTKSITQPFNGGGQRFSQAADGIEQTDLVTLGQIELEFDERLQIGVFGSSTRVARYEDDPKLYKGI